MGTNKKKSKMNRPSFFHLKEQDTLSVYSLRLRKEKKKKIHINNNNKRSRGKSGDRKKLQLGRRRKNSLPQQTMTTKRALVDSSVDSCR